MRLTRLGRKAVAAMPVTFSCDCPLCGMERHLLRIVNVRGSACLAALGFSSSAELLDLLRAAPVHTPSDDVFRSLFRLRPADPDFVESLLVLAFVPMLHRTIHRVALYQPFLSEEDITQQALAAMLEILRSREMAQRKSHYAFAVSRALKRNLFAWGRREGRSNQQFPTIADVPGFLTSTDAFEKQAQLRHFLDRSLKRGELTDAELDLLIRFKLEGMNGKDLFVGNGNSANTTRQRMKRLLAKLRRLAAGDSD
jgi:hypothetical protein